MLNFGSNPEQRILFTIMFKKKPIKIVKDKKKKTSEPEITPNSFNGKTLI